MNAEEDMFRGMEYVYAVYKEKSFLRAAEKLFISQPSLSANVKRVENRVGYPIFDRSTKPLTLTEPGRKYIETVEQMLTAKNMFSDYINKWGDLKTGNLILGGSSLYSSWVLPPLMGKFSKKYPLIRLELVEDSTVKLEKMLQNGEIDIVLDNGKLDETIYESQVFKKEYLILAVPARSKVNQGLEKYQITTDSIRDLSFLDNSVPSVDLHLFAEEPYILLKPDNDTRNRAMELCRQNHFTPNIVFELDQQMTSYNITCSGMGISFISDTLISSVPSHVDVIYYKLGSDISSRNLYFYWKKGRYFSPIMQEFLNSSIVYNDNEY